MFSRHQGHLFVQRDTYAYAVLCQSSNVGSPLVLRHAELGEKEHPEQDHKTHLVDQLTWFL